MQKIALTPRAQQMIYKFLTGGLALGGGLGLATSVANHMQTLKQEGDDAANEGKSDDVLYLKLPKKKVDPNGDPINKMAATNPKKDNGWGLLDSGLGITAGVGGTAASYLLARHIYEKIKKKRVADQLAEAQNGYLGTLQTEAGSKEAATKPDGKPLGISEIGAGGIASTAILSALAASGISYAMLNKYFPQVQHVHSAKPKEIVIQNEDDDNAKLAAATDEDGAQFVLNLVLSAPNLDRQNSPLHKIANIVASGRGEEFENNLVDYGVVQAINMTKEGEALDEDLYTLAKYAAMQLPATSEVLKVLAAGEFAELHPHFYKVASEMDIVRRIALEKTANILGLIGRVAELEKFAAMVEPMGDPEAASPPAHDILNQIIVHLKEQKAQGVSADPHADPNSDVDTQTPDVDDSVETANDLNTSEGDMSDGESAKTEHKDEIDATLAA